MQYGQTCIASRSVRKETEVNALSLIESILLAIAGITSMLVIPAMEDSLEKVTVSEKALMPLYVRVRYLIR